MRSIAPLLFAALLLLTQFACDRSVTTRRLRGQWAVSQYTLNGINQIGTPLTTLTLEFDRDQRGVGNFRLDGVFSDGAPYQDGGQFTYFSATQLRLAFQELFPGEEINMEMELTPEELFLNGTLPDQRGLRIEADAI